MLLAAVAAVAVAAMAAGAAGMSGEERLGRLLERSAERGLISTNGGDFNELVGGGPRPYRLFAWVTSNSGSCSMCNDMRGELEILADGFEKARYPNATSEEAAHRVFFVELDGTRHFDFFKTLDIKYIPHLYHIPPTKTNKRKPWARLFKDEITLEQTWKADDIERNLRSRTRMELAIERPPEPINWAGIFMTVVGGGGMLVFFSTVGRPMLKYMLSPATMLVVSFLFFAFCVSGGMYNRIRNVPWDDGQGNMIAPSSRGQYGAESVMVGFLYVLLSLSIILLNTSVHSLKMSSAAARNIVAAGVLFVFFLLWRYMLQIYNVKNGGYNSGFVWSPFRT